MHRFDPSLPIPCPGYGSSPAWDEDAQQFLCKAEDSPPEETCKDYPGADETGQWWGRCHGLIVVPESVPEAEAERYCRPPFTLWGQNHPRSSKGACYTPGFPVQSSCKEGYAMNREGTCTYAPRPVKCSSKSPPDYFFGTSEHGSPGCVERGWIRRPPMDFLYAPDPSGMEQEQKEQRWRYQALMKQLPEDTRWRLDADPNSGHNKSILFRWLGPECSRPLPGRSTESLWPNICDARLNFLTNHLLKPGGFLARPFLTPEQVAQEAAAGGRGPEPDSHPGRWATLSDSQPGVVVFWHLKPGTGGPGRPRPEFTYNAQAVRLDDMFGPMVQGAR